MSPASPASPASEVRTFEGGCHCGRVRFRVRTAARTALSCNCSICAMKGLLHLIVTRPEFELIEGADDLTTYSFNTHVARHTFCRVCGVQPFYTPRSHPEGVDVNVNCLDGGNGGRFAVVPFDGQRWEENVGAIR